MPRAASRSRAMLWYSKHLLRLHRRMPSPSGMGFLSQCSSAIDAGQPDRSLVTPRRPCMLSELAAAFK